MRWLLRRYGLVIGGVLLAEAALTVFLLRVFGLWPEWAIQTELVVKNLLSW